MRGPFVTTALLTVSLAWSMRAVGQTATPAAPPTEPSTPAAPITSLSQAAPDAPSPAPEPPASEPAEAPAEPPPAAEPPVAPSQPAAPVVMPLPADPAPAPKRDAAPAPPPEKDAWQDGHALAVEALVRGSSRLGDASVNSDAEERAGLGFDLGAWFTLSPEYLLGFGLKRADLGELTLDSGTNSLNAGYATTVLTMGARAFPWRRPGGEIFVGLEVGLAWQDVNATGLQQPANALLPSQPFSCSGGSGPGLALGAEVGANLRLSRALWFTSSFDANAYRLSNDVVGECVAGLGSVTTVSLGAGLLYAFDIGTNSKL